MLTKQLNSFSAVGTEWILFYTSLYVHPKGGKAASCIKLLACFKQRMATSRTVVGTCGRFVIDKIKRIYFQLN